MSDQYKEARERLEQEYKERADRLEHCVPLLQKLVRCMRGDEQDLTGLGLWRIFCNNLEASMQCRVITEEQWHAFLEMQEKLYGTSSR